MRALTVAERRRSGAENSSNRWSSLAGARRWLKAPGPFTVCSMVFEIESDRKPV